MDDNGQRHRDEDEETITPWTPPTNTEDNWLQKVIGHIAKPAPPDQTRETD
jgi:hypothetical protein